MKSISANAKKALKMNGKLIFTTLNALFPIFHSMEQFLNEHGVQSRDTHFDFLTCRETSTIEMMDDAGTKKSINYTERYYMPSEITWYLKTLGFKNIGIFGCHLGAFSRNDSLTPNDMEMLVIAENAD